MLRLLSMAQGRKDLWKPIEPCHVSNFFRYSYFASLLVLAKVATISIGVNRHDYLQKYLIITHILTATPIGRCLIKTPPFDPIPPSHWSGVQQGLGFASISQAEAMATPNTTRIATAFIFHVRCAGEKVRPLLCWSVSRMSKGFRVLFLLIPLCLVIRGCYSVANSLCPACVRMSSLLCSSESRDSCPGPINNT